MKVSKIVSLFSTGVLVVVFCGLAWADPPDLQDMGKIEDGGVALTVTYHAAPTMADWNNDGAKDLIVGDGSGGYVRLYLNQGTDLNPVFNGHTKLEMNGNPIVLSFSS